MTGLDILVVAAVVAATALAAVLAAAETALTRTSTARAEALVEDERRGAVALRTIVDDRDEIVQPVLLVTLACQVGVASAIAVLVRRWWGSGAVVPAFIAVVALLYVLTEALPKALALRDPDRTALALTPVIRVLWWFRPLRWVARGLSGFVAHRAEVDGVPGVDVSEEELLALAEEAAASAVIDDDERALIESIIEFGDTTAREVMVPRPDIVAVTRDFRIVDAIEIVILNGYSRVPVYEDDIDAIVGIVHSKDLMRGERDGLSDEPVSTIMRDISVVPETKRIAPLLREMQAEKFHMAIVVDEYGGTAGLVTLEDLLEEVVGEIVDEFDIEQPMIEQLPEGELRVNGRVALEELAELLDTELPEGEWATVGGLIFSALGHVPTVGESVEIDGHRLEVERVQGRRIARVHVAPVPGS